MNKLQNAFIIGPLLTCLALSIVLLPLTGCQSTNALDERGPWVKRDRAASLNYAVTEWTDAEAGRPDNLRELEAEIVDRYESSVEDFHDIPLTAYIMFY